MAIFGQKIGGGAKKPRKTPKNGVPDALPGGRKSGFFRWDLVSFYRKMGFFGFFDKFEGVNFGGGRKNPKNRGLDRKPGFLIKKWCFSGLSGFRSKNRIPN